MADILLPEDPDFGKEIAWGDAYSKTPKAMLQKNAEQHDSDSLFKYAASTTAHAPDAWVKDAQQTGVSNVMTDPMWFSPLHTPQNWQIASKRREVYQWSFISSSSEKPCYLSNYGGFSLNNIKDVYTKWQTDFASRSSLYIQNDKGEKSKPDICTKRYVEKKANRLKILGLPHPLEITHDHKCIVIKKENVKCSKNKHSSKNCISGVCSPTCIRSECDKYKSIDYELSTVNAEDVCKGDYVLCPFPTEVKESIIKTKEQARFAGHLASDGCISQKEPGVRIFMHPKEEEYVLDSVSPVFDSFDAPVNPKMPNNGSLVMTVRSGKKEFHNFALKLVKNTSASKMYTDEVMLLDPELQKHVLGAYIQSDGSYNKTNEQIEITTISKHLANQLQIMFHRCGILSFCSEQPRRIRKSFPTKNMKYYIISIPKTFVYTLQKYVPGKIPDCIYKPNESESLDTSKFVKGGKTIRRINNRFFWKNYVVSPVVSNTSFDYKGDVYDIRVPPTYAITANGIAINQCRFWYENEPKVAAAIDFYSRFPMNGFTLECPNRKILSFYEHHVVKKLSLNERFKEISSEYFMIGDVFVHTDIECSRCNGTAVDPDTGEECDHPDGMFRRIFIMNPDWIEVQKSPLTDDPLVVLVPDEELQQIVHKRQPKAIYDRIPEKLKPLIMARAPIPLSNRTLSHLRHMPVPYGTYGTSITRRLFTTLAYKTKIMTANWIVAERLILPVRVVKIGSDNRPASSTDIQDIQTQLSATANDPNLTIVTHHNFDYEWYGCMTSEERNCRVLTQDGLKHYNDLTEQDCIATLNEEKEIVYQNYIRRIEFDYNKDNSSGIAYKIGNKKWYGHFTPNHKHYLEDGNIKRSDELNIGDTLIRSNQWEWNGNVPQSLPFKKWNGFEDFTLEEFCRYAGYFVSEGHIKHERGKNLSKQSETQAFGISQNTDSDMYDDLEKLSYKISSNVYIHKDERRKVSTHTFMIANASLSRCLELSFGSTSTKKKLPSWMLDLPKKYLLIIFNSLCEGDGDTQNFRYTTVSSKLRDQFLEIITKLGYSSWYTEESIDLPNRNNIFRIRWTRSMALQKKFKISILEEISYNGKMWCLEMPHGNFFAVVNGHLILTGNTSGKILQVTQEMEHIDKELLDGLMLNQALLNGEAASYSSAQVGVETLIRRIESWRQTLKEWAEERIFKPIAEMQGFVDEEKSEEVGEKVFLYPEIKWNDLELKDKTQYHQMLMQLHDKQTISTQTLLKEIGIDYDTEVKKMRYEQAQMGPAGAMLGQGAGGGGGAMGGMPGGAASPMQGGMDGGMGGDMGGGMGLDGGMGGDMGGAGAAGGGGGGAAAASGKVLKKGKSSSKDDEVVAPMMPIKLTQIEQKMASMLTEVAQTMQFDPSNIRMQFPIENPSGGKHFAADFAIPGLKMIIECFHPDQEIPTNNGSKRIADINNKDRLIGRNGDFVDIVRFIEKPHDGELLNIKAFGMLPLRITKNHPLLVCRPKQVRVKREEPTITRTREYIIPGSPERVLSENVSVGDFLLIPKIKKNEVFEPVSSDSSNELVLSLGNHCSSEGHYRLPSYIFDCSYNFKKSYILGCMEGNTDSRLISNSKLMMLDIQRLCMSMGHFASIDSSEGLWEVFVNFASIFDNRETIYNEDENFFYVPVHEISSKRYVGPVYTFTTEGAEKSNHTYCAGNIVVYNCDGEIWHSSEEQTQDDQERDNLLAQRGWTVLRFDDNTIDDAPQDIKSTINSYIQKAMQAPQKNASVNSANFVKVGSDLKELSVDNYYKYLKANYSSRRDEFKSEMFGKRSKEEYFTNARKI